MSYLCESLGKEFVMAPDSSNSDDNNYVATFKLECFSEFQGSFNVLKAGTFSETNVLSTP